MSDIKVSVVCVTYNHEKYIAEALEGFAAQKTDFPFEVLVHDDASTDGTADIIRKYEKKYPNLIKAVYQKENVYSKGQSPLRDYILPVMKGEYIALCEGDDCWTDENKLQIQYDYMTAHPECAVCVHQAVFHDCVKNTDKVFPEYSESRIFDADELIKLGGGAFSTNSIMMKKRVYTDIPECLSAKGYGDYQLMINGALMGTVYYIARNMAVYNFGVDGSWSRRVLFDKNNAINHCLELIRMLTAFNEAYSKKYDSSVQSVINRCRYSILKNQGKLFEAKKEPYREFYLRDLKRDGFLKYYIRGIVFRFDILYKILMYSRGF